MNKDNPDTVVMDEQAHWQTTQLEDVFLPSVRVQLTWADVESAVDQGAIVPAQAHTLWANWALPGSATRLGAGEAHSEGVDVEVNPGNSAEAGHLPQAPEGASVVLRVVALLAAAAVGAALTLLALGTL
jgi:uncharacterized protein YfaP (DUF2135 family)